MMPAKPGRPQRAHSAGGFVAAVIDGQPRLLLIKNTFDGRWAIPKGHLEAGETPETAAQREIAEETGLMVRVLELLGHDRYTFRADALGRVTGVKTHLIDKSVAVYLCQVVGDPILDPAKFDPVDRLVAEARWFAPDEAVAAIGYAKLKELAATAAAKTKLLA